MAIVPGAGCAARNDSASGAQVIDGSLNFNPEWIVNVTPMAYVSVEY